MLPVSIPTIVSLNVVIISKGLKLKRDAVPLCPEGNNKYVLPCYSNLSEYSLIRFPPVSRVVLCGEKISHRKG